MTTPKKAIYELSEAAVMSLLLSANRRSYGGPGQFIERLPEEVRAQLKELRSEDVSNVADHIIKWMCGV